MTTPSASLPSLAENLAAAGTAVIPVHPDSVGAPRVSIPVPNGWREVDRGVFPGAYGVWALPPEESLGWADNAVLLVGRLSAPVDAAGLLRSAFVDSRRMPQWREVSTDTGDYQGFPSATITGYYTVETLTLWADNRYVVVGAGGDQYLVQLTVTARAGEEGSETALITAGLTIATSVPTDSGEMP
ncbi:LpqN/LpqT family lipoprotein [Nocardia sp. NPDC050406]|uniref:LpqN/LpqT family lipoprotein n=1 Tax=Nocardia sp. NPDC050406 TaxID=3364318 RepID=UPI00379341C8